jgi:hypothetical protein
MTTVLLMLVGSGAVLAGYALGLNHAGRRAPVPCASKLSLDHRAAVVGRVAPLIGGYPLAGYPCELAADHLGPHKHGKPGTRTGEVTWW